MKRLFLASLLAAGCVNAPAPEQEHEASQEVLAPIDRLVDRIEKAGGSQQVFSEPPFHVSMWKNGFTFVTELDPPIRYNPFKGERDFFEFLTYQQNGEVCLIGPGGNNVGLFDEDGDGCMDRMVDYRARMRGRAIVSDPRTLSRDEAPDLFERADSLLEELDAKYRLADIRGLYERLYR